MEDNVLNSSQQTNATTINDQEQMCYTHFDPVYTPTNKNELEQSEMPESIRNLYNSKIEEITNDVSKTINSYQDADELNKIFDDIALDNARSQSYSTIAELVERGFPSTMAVELYKNQQQYNQSYGSGLYSAVAETRMVNQASDSLIMNSCYYDRDDDSAELQEAMQNIMVNYQALDDMATKAFERNNERNIVTKVAVGVPAILPFEQNWNAARKFKNIVKERLGQYDEIKELGDSWDMNKVADATRRALSRAATGSVNNFKQLLNDIDQDLLESSTLTLGDRSNFWSQVQNTTIGLNKFAFGAECVGLIPIVKAGAMAGKAATVGTKSIAKGIASGVMATAKTATNLDSLSAIGSVASKPIKALRFIGNKGKAQKALDDLLSVSVAQRSIDPSSSSEAIKRASREWLENGMAGAYSPNAIKTSSSLASDNMNILSNALEGVEDASDISDAIALAKAMDNGNIQGLERQVKNEVLNSFIGRYLKEKLNYVPRMENISMVSTDKGFSLYTLVGTGKNRTKPFASVNTAQQFADKLNLNKGKYKGFVTNNTADVVVDRTGAYVRIQRDFLDGDKSVALGDLVSSAIKESKLAGKTKGKSFSSSWIGQHIAGANITADYTTRVLNNLKQSDEGMALRLFNPYFKKLKNVKVGHSGVLESLREETAKQGAYFTTSALRNAGIPEDVIEGYRALKIMDDASWLTRMKSTTEGMISNDVKNIKFGTKRVGLGQIIDRPDRKYVNILKDVISEDGKQTFSVEKVPTSSIQSSNVQFVRLTHAINGDNIVAINNASFSYTNPSVMDTLFSYKPGRRQFSQGSGFVKQVISSEVELASGETKKIPTGIRSIFSHPASTKVEKAAETLEAFRQEAIKVSKGKSLVEAQKAIQNIPDWDEIGNFEDFYKLTQGEDALISLDPDAKFIFARDGEKILFNGEEVKDFNFKGASTYQYTNSEKILNTKARTDSDIFNPFNFNQEAPRLNANEEMVIAAENMARYSTLDDYSKLYADDFASAFGDYIDKNATNMWNLLHFDPDAHGSKVPDRVKNQIRNAQLNYKRMMSTTTGWDRWIESVSTNIADKLVPDIKNAGPSRLAFYKALSGGNPIRKAKAWTFNWYLSMYNPKQLWTQMSASLNAINMHPALGTYATTYHFPILAYMNSNDKSIFKKAVEKFGRGKVKELQDVAEIARRLDVYTQASPAGAFELATREAALSGTSWFSPSSFYLKGEYANRTFTSIMAAKEAYDKGFRPATMTAADYSNLVVRQQNLYLNMGRAGTSELQRGLPGFLTQFKGYQMRFLETMLDGELTLAEKSKLYLGQSIFGGFKGVIGGKYAPRWYASLHSAKSSITGDDSYTPVDELAYHGLVDYISMAMGSNHSFGNAWSVGLGDIFTIALDTSIADMPPAVSMFEKPVGLASTIYRGFMNHLSLDIEDRDYAAMLSSMAQTASAKKQLPGGISNLLAGYYSLKSGSKLSYNGQLSVGSQDALDSFLTAVGIRDISDDQYALMLAEKTRLEEDEREQKKLSSELLGYALNAPSDEVQRVRLKEVKRMVGMIAEDNPELGRKIFNGVYSFENMRGVKQEKRVKLLENMLEDAPHLKKQYQKHYDDAINRKQNVQE